MRERERDMLFCGETEVLFLDIFSGPSPLPRSPAPPHRPVYLTVLKGERETMREREREKREKRERNERERESENSLLRGETEVLCLAMFSGPPPFPHLASATPGFRTQASCSNVEKKERQ